MGETEVTQPATKKRGRPREYPSAQAKAAAKAQRKRAKRAEEAAKRQEKWHNTFLVPELPSVLPDLPPMMNNKNAALQQFFDGSGTASDVPSGIEAGLPCNIHTGLWTLIWLQAGHRSGFGTGRTHHEPADDRPWIRNGICCPRR